MSPEAHERTRILRMIEEGKLSADEAERLLDALDQRPDKEAPKNERIRVSVTSNGIPRVNVTVPLQLARNVLRFVPQRTRQDGMDVEGIMRLIEQGATGKILDVDHDGHHVEIFVE